MGVGSRVQTGATMTIVLVIGVSAALTAELTKLGLETVQCVQAFRELAEGIPAAVLPPYVTTERAPAPQFGGDRPYLKRKKGRA
jgi:hypothetical protein